MLICSGRTFRALVALLVTLAAAIPLNAQGCNGDAKFIMRGDLYRYGFFARYERVLTYGPVTDSYSIDYSYPNSTATRYVNTQLDFSGAGGSISVDINNRAFLRATRLDGNDWGGEFVPAVDIYVKGPPGTPFFVQQNLAGSATVNRGPGAGTTHAAMISALAVINNGAGFQTVPVSLNGSFTGSTSSQLHPTCPEYSLAASVTYGGFNFTFQSIDFCFPSCPQLYDYDSLSLLSGSLSAGCVGGCQEDDPNPPPGCGDENAPGAPSTPQCCSAGGPSDTTGIADPIYFFSGEVYLNEEDMRIRGRGPDFVWARRYRSKISTSSPQGTNWDCSYNIRLQPDNASLALFNGWNRAETYVPSGVNRWTRDEFFNELTREPDGSFTLTFADTSRWRFRPLDASPAAGRISASIDRNGNSMSFAYDAQGRLQTITDTLGRPITVAYTPSGQVQSVTDFDGRQVVYEYYNGAEPGGALGDLKSVRSPVVTGTPNGNDFPAGKTTRYTYTTGFTDDRLNHNLLTVTDARGNTFVSNEYAATTDPSDLSFDRVRRQRWGNPGDIIDIVPVALTPSPANNNAVVKAIVNDREGHVKELFYDAQSRLVIRRDYTGLADPDQPTTDSTNRPTGRLRPTDPEFFETRWEFNADSLASRIVHPNGDVELFFYDTVNASRRSQGNMIERRRVPGPLGGAQPQISEFFEYDNDLGGCCGTNFVTRHTDPRGNVTLHEYDDLGNRTRTTFPIPGIVEDWEYNTFGQLSAHLHPDNGSGHRQRDTFSYYDAGPQRGYLHAVIHDAGQLNLTTTYEYDGRGNVVRTIDPRGNDTLFAVNQLDQTVRTSSPIINTPGGPIRYTTDTFYDANNNVARTDVLNINDAGVLQANTHFTTSHEYDILNMLVRTTREVDASSSIVTEYGYDANRNRTLERRGLATSGADPFNQVRTAYDERDLPFRISRAFGSPQQSTTQLDYDPNGNIATVRAGIENAPRVTTNTYDGYNRLVRVEDAMGNAVTHSYDAASNRTGTRRDGELVDAPGNVMNIRLAEETRSYDAMNRLTRIDAAFFNPATQAPIADGLAARQIVYTPRSQVARVIDDNSRETVHSYDTAGRILSVVDPEGNAVTSTYDAGSNLIASLSTERSDLPEPDQLFTNRTEYDALNRRTAAIDSSGNRTEFAYDSRSNLTRARDPRANIVLHRFDGLDRLTSTIRFLTPDGSQTITTSQAWDASSRLVSQTDDNGNATAYGYDSLDRRTTTTYADGTTHAIQYDVHDNAAVSNDANGSLVVSTFDLKNRLAGRTITPGPGVSPETTEETYAYDGLDRLIYAEDDDSIVVRSYDSISNITLEVLNGQQTACVFDGEGNETRCTYPGGRVVTTTYDGLNRKSVIRESTAGPLIASYDYVGPTRVRRKMLGNGTRTDYTYDGVTGVPNPAGDFGDRRIVRITHSRSSGGPLIDDRAFTWDRAGNKTSRDNVRPGGPLPEEQGERLRHDYTYDAVNRLVGTTVRNHATGLPGPIVRDTAYDLDGVHNRRSVTGPGTPRLEEGVYACDDAPPRDCEVNQYTRTPADAREYDLNGNLARVTPICACDWNKDRRLNSQDFFDFLTDFLAESIDGDFNGDTLINSQDFFDFLSCFFSECDPAPTIIRSNYRDMMVEHDVPGDARSTYAYDALGRRIAQSVTRNGVTATIRYFLHDWQVIEERDAANAVTATYVHGLYIDEALQMLRNTRGDPAPDAHYYHADDMHSTVAITDETGAVLERYEYEDYGESLVYSSSLQQRSSGFYGNSRTFTGSSLDSSGLYYFRSRYLNSLTGYFTSPDTIGRWKDASGYGNGFSYAGASPASFLDPLGTHRQDKDFGIKDREFWDWWHGQKQKHNLPNLETREEAMREYNEWMEQGKPAGKGGKGHDRRPQRMKPRGFRLPCWPFLLWDAWRSWEDFQEMQEEEYRRWQIENMA